MSVELLKQLYWIGSIYWQRMKSKGVSQCVQRGAAVFGVDKLYPMSHVNHHRVVLADSE